MPTWKGRDFTYKATKRLGAGMDGTVYLARATPTDPGKPSLIVAVKQAKTSREARKSLETEWLVGRRLGVWPECHPMFPCMLELGPNGTWFSREFVEGVTVEKAIKTWPRAQLFANVRSLLGNLARAQRTAHEQAVVHYDGQTGNMLVRPDGTLTLIDFGRSCLMLRDARGLLKCQRGDKEKDIRTSLGFIEDDVLDRVGSFRDLPPDLRKAFNARSIEALMAALGVANVPPRAVAYAMDPHQIRIA